MKINFYDTSAILHIDTNLKGAHYISPLVLTELEHIKNSKTKDDHIKYLAREAIRFLMSEESPIYQASFLASPIHQKAINRLIKKYKFLSDINDHRILCEAIYAQKHFFEDEEFYFITSDSSLYLFALNFPQIHPTYMPDIMKIQNEQYSGWGKYYPNMEQMNSLYSYPEQNILNAKVNEYCHIYEGSELKDILRWDGNRYQKLKYNNIENKSFDIKVKPRNLHQKMMMDLLQNPDIPIKLVTGVYGSGKDYVATSQALDLVAKGKKQKIVFVRNLIDLKDTPQIGYLPNGIEEKISWGLGPIQDILGGEDALNYFTDNHMIEAVNLGFCRGRSWKDAIVYVTEGQNLTSSQIKLLISRLGEGSELWINGDYHGQVDKEVFEKDNGLKLLQKRLAGNPMFGCVDLIKTERSLQAELASLLD